MPPGKTVFSVRQAQEGLLAWFPFFLALKRDVMSKVRQPFCYLVAIMNMQKDGRVKDQSKAGALSTLQSS